MLLFFSCNRRTVILYWDCVFVPGYNLHFNVKLWHGMSSRFGTEKKGLGTLKRETTSWSQSPPNPNLSYRPRLMNTRHQGTGKGKEEQKEIYIKSVKYCPKIKTWLVREKTLIILCLESPDFQWSNITLLFFSLLFKFLSLIMFIW